MSRGTLDPALLLSISDTRLSRILAGLPRPFSYQLQINYAVLTPKDKSSGLGSFPFDHPTYLVQSDSPASSVRHSQFDILR